MPTKIEGAIRRDILLVPLEQIHVDPATNYRQDLGDVTGLASSISHEGILQPLRVKRGQDGQLELLSGFRRWAAVQHLKEQGIDIERVPCVFQDRAKLGEGDTLVAQLLENAHRKEASPLERARAYDRLIRVIGLDVGEVASRLGENTAVIRSYLTLLTAPASVTKALEKGMISMTAANHVIRKAGGDEDKSREHLQAALNASGGTRATVKATRKAKPTEKPRRRCRGIAEVLAKISELEETLKEEKAREGGPHEGVQSELLTCIRTLKWCAGADLKVW